MAPTSEWSTLITVLKQAVVGPNKKTVITLDMQLYEKAKQLEMSRPDCKNQWIPRIGELHTTMAALRAAGSYIEGSGLDDAWVEADIFSPTTVREILKCKHYKRTLNAHIASLLALFSLYQKAFFADNPRLLAQAELLEKQVEQSCNDRIAVEESHKAMVQEINDKLSSKLEEFNQRNLVQPIFKVFFNYMELIMSIFSFI